MNRRAKPLRTALVTGSAGGIGQALCRKFHGAGYRVVGVDIREPMAFVPGQSLRFDLTRLAQDSAKVFFEEAAEWLGGRLDALINNAGWQVVKPVEKLTAEDWRTALRVNLMAPFWLVQGFLAQLRAARGAVVNIASIHAEQTKPGFVAYAASKGALVALTRALAVELAPEVRVNALIPAATDTPMLRAGLSKRPGALKRLGDYHPLRRIADPEEVADAALFLASERSGFITGAALAVDGGISALLHDPAL